MAKDLGVSALETLIQTRTMKYFQDIPKEWKQARTEKRCEQCNTPLAVDKDHFTVHAHWKIKDEADTYSFCSLACIGMWTQEESLVEV